MTPFRSHRATRMRVALFLSTITLLSLPAAALADEDAGSAPTTAPQATPDWPASVLDTFATIPVQDEGRIKPFHTFANFTLLRMNHKRSCKTPDGEKRKAVAWLLDTLLRPEVARHYEVFMVEDGAVLDAVGLSETRKKKRDRYSFAEIEPARASLSKLGRSYAAIEANKRSPVEAGVLKLAHDLTQLDWFLHYFDFARRTYDVSDPGLAEWFPKGGRATFGEIAPHLGAIVSAARGKERNPHAHAGAPGANRAAARLTESVVRTAFVARAITLIPPAKNAADPTWITPSDLVQLMTTGPQDPDQVRILTLLGDVAAASDDPTLLSAATDELHTEVRRQAAPYVDTGKIDLEVFLYELDPFYLAQILFILAFVLVALTWLGNWKWVARGAWTLMLLGLGLAIAGIVIRSVLRGRPPISTLYETVLFVTAFFVAASLVVELMNRNRIAFSLAPILGVLGLFIAGKYEVVHGQDTMPQLIAVLDTNFWLATHVTCITIGYAAGLLTSAIGHVYVLGKVFGFRRGDATFYRNVGRMVYGMLGFSLIFSIVGTILGGIWANESWGRFWGWDPKENGALLIVLTTLMILHGRMGGYIKTYGVALSSVFLGAVVAFSWWHVNLLGIGLHSYGFTAGIMRGLLIFYAIEGAVILTGLAWSLRTRGKPAPT